MRLAAQCAHVAASIEDLRAKGVVLPDEPDRVHHFVFMGMGDLKWQRLAMGKTSSSSMFPCLWCHVRRPHMAGALAAQKGQVDCGFDPLDHMPTVIFFLASFFVCCCFVFCSLSPLCMSFHLPPIGHI